MSTLDRMNDRYGNLDSTVSSFYKKHEGETILYCSAGALFRRKGDTFFKKWSVLFNRRGNLIVSDKRCYFSNPMISGRSFMLLMVPLYLFLMIMMMGMIFVLVYGLIGSMIAALLCDLLFFPLILLMLIGLVVNLYQRLPIEVDLEHEEMKRMYLGSYRTISRPSPMFSCFDGKYTYHFVGYRKLDDESMDKIEKIFGFAEDSLVS